MFPSSIEREMRKFYVVVVQRRQSNVQKKRDARGKLLFRLSKPIAFFPVLIVFAVVVAWVPYFDREDLVRPRTGTRQLPYHLIQKKLLTKSWKRLEGRAGICLLNFTYIPLQNFWLRPCARLAWTVKAFLFISLFSFTSFPSSRVSQETKQWNAWGSKTKSFGVEI